MYGLALCLPRVGQPQGLPVSHKIPKTLDLKECAPITNLLYFV
jgi:hypothetical protein